MKIKININIKKEYILYISIFFIVLIAFLTLKTYFTSTHEIELTYPNEFYNELTSYKDEIVNYKDTECKKFVEEFIDEVDAGRLNGEYDIQTIYIFAKSINFIKVYNDGNTSCNIDKHTKDIISNTYLAYFANDMVFPYMTQYELTFRNEAKIGNVKDYVDVLYYSLKKDEITLLKIYMDSLRKENNHE